jgi:hypothetical protein
MYEIATEQARSELLADLRSTSWADDPGRSALAWTHRPAILRRVALALAALVPPDTDRILVIGPAASSLGTAVSLISGIPFRTVDSTEPGGETNGHERIVLVAFFGEDLAAPRFPGTVPRLCLCTSDPSTNVTAVFENGWTRPHRSLNGAEK